MTKSRNAAHGPVSHRPHSHKKSQTVSVAMVLRIKFISQATLVAAILEPLMTIPQAYTIFRYQDASGVSLSTWAGYEILTVVWLLYAIARKERMIFIYQGLFMIMQTVVIIGGLLYGARW